MRRSVAVLRLKNFIATIPKEASVDHLADIILSFIERNNLMRPPYLNAVRLTDRINGTWDKEKEEDEYIG